MIVLSGGTGTPKLLLGLKEVLAPFDLSIVVNTAEDLWISGNFVSPDIDTVLYTLAGIIDDTKWWGIKGDSFHTYEFLRNLGKQEILALGDKDRAAHIFRSDILRKGGSLSEATIKLAKALGIKQKVIPMTDDPVSTIIATSEGEMHFQDFWVGHKGEPDVLSLWLHGIENASPSRCFMDILSKEDTVLIGPSNPVTSIGPILALRGVRDAFKDKKVIAISPLVGGKPVSGPAGKFMKASNVSTNDEGVVALLGKIDLFVVDLMSGYPGRCKRLDTLMRSNLDSIRLAREVIELI